MRLSEAYPIRYVILVFTLCYLINRLIDLFEEIILGYEFNWMLQGIGVAIYVYYLLNRDKYDY